LRQSFHSTTTITTNNQQTSWQRSAKLVKKDPTDATSTETTKHLHYLDTIRASHDPSLHIKTLEDELMGTMGAALGKQAEKIKYYLQQMEIQKNIYTTLVREQGSEHILIQETAIRYNEFRKMAKQARWELLVHRQAVGFIVNNHNVGEWNPLYCVGGPELFCIANDRQRRSHCWTFPSIHSTRNISNRRTTANESK